MRDEGEPGGHHLGVSPFGLVERRELTRIEGCAGRGEPEVRRLLLVEGLGGPGGALEGFVLMVLVDWCGARGAARRRRRGDRRLSRRASTEQPDPDDQGREVLAEMVGGGRVPLLVLMPGPE